MKSRGRFIAWAEFLRAMRETGGTCIEERFSPKGPVRFWWTPENVYRESPTKSLIGSRCAKAAVRSRLFRWCRERYTNADGGSAVLVRRAVCAEEGDLHAMGRVQIRSGRSAMG